MLVLTEECVFLPETNDLQLTSLSQASRHLPGDKLSIVLISRELESWLLQSLFGILFHDEFHTQLLLSLQGVSVDNDVALQASILVESRLCLTL